MTEQKSIQIVFAATYKNLAAIGAWIRLQLRDIIDEKTKASGTESEAIHDIELAVHEICNNIIEHAYGHQNGHIDVYFTHDKRESCVTIDLYDKGKPFDPTEVSVPDLARPQEGGYGLFLAQELLDEVTHSLHSPANGLVENHWHLVKYL